MDFLKNISLSQPPEHFHLLVFISAISYIVFMPYLCFALGSSAISYWFNARGRKENNLLYMKFSKELVEIVFYNKSLVAFLAVFPGLSIVFAYAQMLQSTPAISVDLAGFGFLLLFAGFILLYSYKYTFHVQGILESYQGILKAGSAGEQKTSDLESYSRRNVLTHRRSGRYGLALLISGTFLYASAIVVTADPASWVQVETVFDLFLSPGVWFKFLETLALSAGITSLGILFFFITLDIKKGIMEGGLSVIILATCRRLAAVSLIALPLLVLLNMLVLPEASLSGTLYLLAGAAVSFLFLSAHFIYAYFKTSDRRAIAFGLIAFFLAGAALTVNDHIALGTGSRQHAAVLAAASDKETDELKSKLGIVSVTLTGEDIYNARCSACHLFDTKKVGPPYNEVIPKYAGKKAQLIAFVMSPVKINPDYPPMPNQGLRPAEADSIASYLIGKVLEGGKGKDTLMQKPSK